MEISATAAAQPSTGSATNAFEDLDGQAFMQLLVAQLKNQNPLDPMKNQEFMSEMAQLSSLEQLQSISGDVKSAASAGQLGWASSLLGRQVEWAGADGLPQQGVVREISQDQQSIHLQIDGSAVPLESVRRVAPAPVEGSL